MLQKESILLNKYCNRRKKIATAIDVANSHPRRPAVKGKVKGVGLNLSLFESEARSLISSMQLTKHQFCHL